MYYIYTIAPYLHLIKVVDVINMIQFHIRRNIMKNRCEFSFLIGHLYRTIINGYEAPPFSGRRNFSNFLILRTVCRTDNHPSQGLYLRTLQQGQHKRTR
jgi:hypothetical protein